jgi:hypothetical protein
MGSLVPLVLLVRSRDTMNGVGSIHRVLGLREVVGLGLLKIRLL